jgi:hypothetical protein
MSPLRSGGCSALVSSLRSERTIARVRARPLPSHPASTGSRGTALTTDRSGDPGCSLRRRAIRFSGHPSGRTAHLESVIALARHVEIESVRPQIEAPEVASRLSSEALDVQLPHAVPQCARIPLQTRPPVRQPRPSVITMGPESLDAPWATRQGPSGLGLGDSARRA